MSSSPPSSPRATTPVLSQCQAQSAMSSSNSAASRRIMIPLDGTCASEGAFWWYLDNLRRDGDALLIVHVVEPPSLPSFSLKSGFGVPVEAWQDILAQSGKQAKEMEEQVAVWANNYKIKIDFIAESSKRPGQALVEIAYRSQCHLIVMSTRDLSDIRRAFIGSVSDFVIHHCHMPVCVIPGACALSQQSEIQSRLQSHGAAEASLTP